MLIANDSRDLGDKRLNAEEGLLELKERNQPLIDRRKIAGQAELEDLERASGPRIHWTKLIHRLQELNSQLIFKDGSPGNIAVYYPRNRKEREEHEWDFGKPEWWNDCKYVTGFPKDWIPEYSTISADERGLPKRENRGWRSILIALIKAQAVTYRGAVKEFGQARGERSRRWHEETRKYR